MHCLGAGVSLNSKPLQTSRPAWQRVCYRVGNVELETLRGEGGCGCAYPDYVEDAFAGRAAAIVDGLRDAARDADADDDVLPWLGGLPTSATFDVGGCRVAAVHGDPTCVGTAARTPEVGRDEI